MGGQAANSGCNAGWVGGHTANSTGWLDARLVD